MTQHSCSLQSGSGPRLFKNDANNVAALQDARRQKLLMEEAARLQQKQLQDAADALQIQIEDKEMIKEERNKLQNEKKSLNLIIEQKDKLLAEAEKTETRNKEQLEQANSNLLSHSTEIEKLKQNLEQKITESDAFLKQVDAASTLDLQQQADIRRLEGAVSSMKKKLPDGRQENSLPLQYDGATVIIVNLQSQLALDAGKDGDTRAHGWQYHLDNGNQIFMLSRVNTDPGYWTIKVKRNSNNLYYPTSATDVDVHAGSAPGKQDYWYIGRGGSDRIASWVIKNVEWGTYIALAGSGRQNGVRARSCNAPNDYDANWLIIPFYFNG